MIYEVNTLVLEFYSVVLESKWELLLQNGLNSPLYTISYFCYLLLESLTNNI